MSEVEEFIQHHGVKGMRWGVRRYQPYEKGPGKPKGKFIKKVKKKVSDSRLGQEVRSAKRELETLKTKSNLDNMSTKEIREKGRRMQQENEMKKLSRTGKEKKDYRNRGNMSSQEITRKLDRLKTKDLLSQNADKAAKKYVDAGKRVADTVSALAVSYAFNDGEITREQITNALTNPKKARSREIINKGLSGISGLNLDKKMK